jgi:hypothetical protein
LADPRGSEKGPCLAAGSRRLRRYRLGTGRLLVCCVAPPGFWEAILRKMREEAGATNLLGLHESAIYRYIAPALASGTVPERQARGTTARIANMQGEQTASVGLLGSVVEVSVSRLARNRAALRQADVSTTRFLTRSDCSHSTPPSRGACGRSVASQHNVLFSVDVRIETAGARPNPPPFPSKSRYAGGTTSDCRRHMFYIRLKPLIRLGPIPRHGPRLD